MRDVRTTHINLGHCLRQTLLRCLRVSKASPDHIDGDKRWVCGLCARRAPPATARPAAVPRAPVRFGHTTDVDLRQEVDAEGKAYNTLGIVYARRGHAALFTACVATAHLALADRRKPRAPSTYYLLPANRPTNLPA